MQEKSHREWPERPLPNGKSWQRITSVFRVTYWNKSELMIFATVGTQVPFDRFVKAVDEIAPEIGEPIIAQTIGCTYQAKNIETVGLLSPDEFNKIFDAARLIVAHAGMGTILSALTRQKPIIVMPRLAAYKEHRNDHQISTAMKLHELGYIHVAYDNLQLRRLMCDRPSYLLKQSGIVQVTDWHYPSSILLRRDSD